MTFAQRLQEIRTGFQRPFWVANTSEVFERLAYYAAFASLANYLHEKLNFPTEQTGTLTGIFGGMVWFLAIFGGAAADRLGFRRALSLAYLILSGAYFLLGSLGAAWLAPVRSAIPPEIFVGFILILPALGISLVKPSVVGTTARASTENVRSIGYSIYYTMVNIGGAAGPYVASWAHRHLGVENVFRIAALSVFLMFFAVLLFFHEPRPGANSADAPGRANPAGGTQTRRGNAASNVSSDARVERQLGDIASDALVQTRRGGASSEGGSETGAERRRGDVASDATMQTRRGGASSEGGSETGAERRRGDVASDAFVQTRRGDAASNVGSDAGVETCAASETPSIARTLRNFLVVVSNPKFMLFLIIFTGYWVVYWQQFTTLPGYIHDYVDPHADVELILITDAFSVICLTLIINYLTRAIPAFRAIILGTLVTGLSWLILAAHPAIWTCVLAIFVLALGEIVHQPRYYEYISRLAPPGQQGTYMGFAFLPIGLGSLIGGWFGGRLLHHFGEVRHQPQRVWWAVSGVGVLTALLLVVYDRAVAPGAAPGDGGK